jgi:hypothetical protein
LVLAEIAESDEGDFARQSADVLQEQQIDDLPHGSNPCACLLLFLAQPDFNFST